MSAGRIATSGIRMKHTRRRYLNSTKLRAENVNWKTLHRGASVRSCHRTNDRPTCTRRACERNNNRTFALYGQNDKLRGWNSYVHERHVIIYVPSRTVADRRICFIPPDNNDNIDTSTTTITIISGPRNPDAWAHCPQNVWRDVLPGDAWTLSTR